MSEPNIEEMSRHLRHLISITLDMNEDLIDAKVHTIFCKDGYICHLKIMLAGQEPSKTQGGLIIAALKRYGFPGIRVTDVRIPAEA